MSAIRAFRKSLKAAIDAASLGASVYDGAPASAVFPYIEIGSSDGIPNDADCVNGVDITMQVDVWGRDQGKMNPTEDLTFDVRDAIHEAQLTLDSPYVCRNVRVVMFQCFMDPDGITAHGVIQATGLIEDTTP